MNNSIKYFLGSNTNEGFYSLFDELYNPEEDWQVYIIKGGPGCGKSTLMGKIAKTLEERGEAIEHIMCASDPESYDGVIWRKRKIALVDGTAPHVMEPHYYGAVEEIVNLGEALNIAGIRKDASEIRRLTAKNAACYRKCTNYLNAAAMLMRNSKKLQAEYINYEKLYNYVMHFAKRELKDGKADGKVTYRFMTAITNKGEVTFFDEIAKGCKRIIGIDDPIGSVSGQLLDCLLTVALDCGINTVAGVSPYDTEELLELVFPDDDICLVRKTDDIEVHRTVHASRFLNMQGMRAHKYRLAFNKKAANELFRAAVMHLEDAKSVHDEMEKIYVENIDYKKINEKSKLLVEKITNFV